MNAFNVNPENRAISSIFISDISYDFNEEALRALFSEVGQVVNFRVIPDKTPNKSKIAFCEYKNPEMALRAIVSLNNYDIKGQAIHVDLATSEKCMQEIARLQGNIESSVDFTDASGDKAPEEISKAVASLPAEQMFELMKQMKMCIENNPQEARNLLLQNPQLAYALLQAQVIMRIVDPNVAIKLLNRTSPPDLNTEVKNEPVAASANENPSTYPAGMPSVTAEPMSVNIPVSHPDLGPTPSSLPGPISGIIQGPVQGVIPNPLSGIIPNTVSGVIPSTAPGVIPTPVTGVLPGIVPTGISGTQNIPRTSNQFADQDLRTLGDQDLRTLPSISDHDMRTSAVLSVVDKDMRQPMGDQDFRTLPVPATAPEARPFDPRFRNMQPDRNAIPGFDRPRPTIVDPRTVQDPRNSGATPRVEDPRKASSAASVNSRLSAAGPALQSLGSNVTQSPIGPAGMVPEEQEKAALIMQVLQLTEQQIAALPPEQRQSIMVLKEQLARSQML